MPGLGQFYNGDHLEGAIFVGIQAALIGSSIALEVQGRRHLDRYRLGSESTLDDYDAAMQAFDRRTWLLGAAGVVWAFGIARAWMAGSDYDPRSSFDTSVEVVPGSATGVGLSLQGLW